MPDGTTITVMARSEDDLRALIDRSALVLSEARLAIRNTSLGLLRRPLPDLVVDGGRRYFSLDLGADSAFHDFAKIKRVLKGLATGLRGDVTIKTGEFVGMGDEDVYGQVTTQNVTDASRSGNEAAELLVNHPQYRSQYRHKRHHHSFTTDLDTGDLLLTRAIKIDSARLRGHLHLAVKTFLHEASHKYAGTVDHGLFPDGNPAQPALQKTQALANADSYAWFVVVAGYRGPLP